MAFETFADVVESLSRFIEGVYNSRRSIRPWLFEPATIRGSPHPAHSQIGSLIFVRPEGPTPSGGPFQR